MHLEKNKKLFVLEMANNHMGDVNHGIEMIRCYGKIIKKFPFKFAFKLQYRNLSTFIHKDLKHRQDVPLIKRFSETKLQPHEFRKLIKCMKNNNFTPMCTPFDEDSVDKIVEDGFEIIKVASCSFTDWNLIEKIAQVNKPIIASTAGASLEDIKKVVNFYKNRNKEFALMHCVAQYPTPKKNLNLNRLKYLKDKYPELRIGYSTHEDPDDTNIVPLAIAMGATIFEKHVGLPTEKYSLNKYSASPEQFERWLETASESYKICGDSKLIFKKNKEEIQSLNPLKRGIYIKKDISKGCVIDKKDLYLAFPPQKNQITADYFSKYHTFVTKKKIQKDKPLLFTNCKIKNNRDKVYKIVEKSKSILKLSNQFLKGQHDFEISHHYGLNSFEKFGLVMVTILNNTQYCKKLLIVFPGQTHPEQWHKKKEETFNILHGSINMKLDGRSKTYSAGSLVNIKPGTRHEFSSKKGSVIEEISTTHYNADSFYTDKKIMQNLDRKTFVPYHWKS